LEQVNRVLLRSHWRQEKDLGRLLGTALEALADPHRRLLTLGPFFLRLWV
jgi:hypothetical protein